MAKIQKIKKVYYEILSFLIISSIFFRLENFPMIDMMFSVVSVMVVAWGLFKYWRNLRIVWKFILFEFLFYFFITVNTVYNGSDVNFYGQFSFFLKGITLIAVLLQSRFIGSKEPIKILVKVISIMLILNLLQMVFLPTIMGSINGKQLYLIAGNYNQFGGPIALVLLSCFLLTKDGLKWNVFYIFIQFLTLSTVMLCGSVTTSIAIVLIMLYYFFVRFNNLLSKWAVLFMLFILIIVFLDFVLSDIDLLGRQSFLESFFEYTGKDPTFSGRTQVWARSIFIILSKPLTGVGLYAGESVKSVLGAFNSHNIILDFLLVGGFIFTVPIVILILLLIHLMKVHLKTYYYYGLVFIFEVLLLMLQFEVYSYYMLLLFIFVMYYSLQVDNFLNKQNI